MFVNRSFLRALSLAFTLTSALAAAPLAQGADLQTVRIGVDPYTTGAQIWVALDKGYFKDNGIDANITTYATGVETLDGVLTGRTEIGVGLDFPTALRMQSRQLTILASIFKSTPGWHKLAVSDAVKAPNDLVGKKLGIATGTAQHLVTIKYLENHGISADKVTLVPFSSLVEIVASLKAGRLDGAFVWADGTKQATDSGFHILADDGEAKLNQRAYVSANTAYAKKNAKVVEAVLKSMDAATKFINEDREAAAAMIAAHTKAPKDSVSKLLQLNKFQLELTDDEKTSFATIAEFASSVLKTPVSFDTAADPAYLRAAVPDSVKLSK